MSTLRVAARPGLRRISRSGVGRVLQLGLVMICAGTASFGDEPPAGETDAAPRGCPGVDHVRTVSARSESHQDRVRLDEWLIIEVTDVDALLCDAEAMLYLDGKQAPMDEPAFRKGTNEIGFRLTHTQTPEAVTFWNDLFQPLRLTRTVTVGVGPDEGPIPAQGEVTIDLVVVPLVRFFVWVVLFVVGVLVLIWLGRNTNMLRDGPASAAPGSRARYSLGRTQMAFWFALVAGAFSFIWLVTEELDTLTGSVVVLVGISAGTALGSVAVAAGKGKTASAELSSSVEEQKTLESTAASAAAAPGADPTEAAAKRAAQQVRIDMLGEKIRALQKTVSLRPTSSFWSDILSDAGGIALPRVQIVAWTVILGIVFGHQVYEHLSMPDFSDRLLALMGVSSGTYVGFKFPETK